MNFHPSLISELKANEQDFEFYPTTREMVEVIYNDLARRGREETSYSMLDIGCGNGNVFTKFREIREEARTHNIALGMGESEDCYGGAKDSEYLLANMRPKATITDQFAIEKSEILIRNLPNDVVVIGTDFWQSTLLDKKVDIIFSNPPYSEFESWVVKIINEAYCKTIYLIIPERWKNSTLIEIALRERKFKTKVLASTDFLDSQRSARAKVDIVKISTPGSSDFYYSREKRYDDPFDVWFQKEFLAGVEDPSDNPQSEEQKHEEQVKQELAKGKDLIQVLEELYTVEMGSLIESHRKITSIEPALLKELGVSHENLRKGLQEKIKGLKYKYWHELFRNLDKIKKRLTSTKRKAILDKLYQNVSVDFTIQNAYAVVIWIIKNSNQYFDEQLKEMYMRLTEPEYVKNYKSNQRTWQSDGWRYAKEDHSHYTLDYRIVTRDYKSYGHSDLIDDIKTIAYNLGFDDIGDVKEFQNGNVHFRFNKQFMKAFNIEAARLFGWLRKPQDVVDEFDAGCGVTHTDAEQYFQANFLLEQGNPRLLLGC